MCELKRQERVVTVFIPSNSTDLAEFVRAEIISR